jgi:hypothetical protein
MGAFDFLEILKSQTSSHNSCCLTADFPPLIDFAQSAQVELVSSADG